MRTIHLAHRLNSKGILDRLFIPHYRSLVQDIRKASNMNSIRLSTSIIAPMIHKAVAVMNADAFFPFDRRYLFAEALDRTVAGKLSRGSDIVFAESNIALHTLRKARKVGATAILDRTNSHIEYQTDLLNEEYARLGIDHVFNSQQIVDKGMQEYHEADYICVLSSFVKRTFLEKNIPSEKLLLIPSGVSLSDFRQVSKEDNVFRIIFCGLASIKKGVHYLFEAFDELKLKHAELWIIGAIYEDVKLIASRYGHLFRHFEYVPHADLYKYFSQGSVFVLPSLEEGMAKVIMEAMACGLPVIATTNTGAEDIYDNEKEGFIIPIQDKDALKEKLLYYYENQNEALRMGQMGKEKVRNGLSWDDYADRLLKSFSTIISSKRKN